MKAHKLETSLTENGTLVLKDLPFQVGDAVEVIILESHPLTSENNSQSYCYDDPFESATPLEDWEVN
ncbi:MAG: hypothetical protein U7127_10340 [Phormidium sp.]